MPFLRMNLFQRMARQWDGLHPYNAGQLMYIAATIDPHHAVACWSQTLRELGMGGIEWSHRRYRHVPADAPATLLDDQVCLNGFIADQLNMPFGEPSQGPFRAFVRREGQTTCLCVFYHHWVADSISIRMLIREWFYRCCAPQLASRRALVMRDGAAGGVSWGSSFRAVGSLLAWSMHVKQVRRLSPQAQENLDVGFRLLQLPDGTAGRLHRAARLRGVKVTDLMLCSLVQTCHRQMPVTHAHRPGLAVGTIRDIRATNPRDNGDAFGMALSSATITCPASTLDGTEGLLNHIAAENKRHREPSSLAAHRLTLRLGLLAGRLMNHRSLIDFYRRRMPLSGGLSNVNLNDTWVAHHHPSPITSFVRISPTGPMLPLVMTPTTLCEKFNIAITFRKTVFAPDAIDALLCMLVDSLESWCVESPAGDPAPAGNVTQNIDRPENAS